MCRILGYSFSFFLIEESTESLPPTRYALPMSHHSETQRKTGNPEKYGAFPSRTRPLGLTTRISGWMALLATCSPPPKAPHTHGIRSTVSASTLASRNFTPQLVFRPALESCICRPPILCLHCLLIGRMRSIFNQKAACESMK